MEGDKIMGDKMGGIKKGGDILIGETKKRMTGSQIRVPLAGNHIQWIWSVTYVDLPALQQNVHRSYSVSPFLSGISIGSWWSWWPLG